MDQVWCSDAHAYFMEMLHTCDVPETIQDGTIPVKHPDIDKYVEAESVSTFGVQP